MIVVYYFTNNMKKILDSKEVSKLRGVGFSQIEIAKRFGVSQQAVSQILLRSKKKYYEGEKISDAKTDTML